MADGSDGAGEARALASGTLLQQVAQVAGLLAMFAVVTVLARRLTLTEFGAFALLNSISGYLLIVQNAAAGAAVRTIAAASQEAGDRAYSAAAVVFAVAGLVTGLALLLIGLVLAAALDVPGAVADEIRLGALGLCLVTVVGWPLTVARDGLRGRDRIALAATMEIAGIAAYAALTLTLAFADAPLWSLIASGGAIPLLAGLACALAARRALDLRFRPRQISRAALRELGALAAYVSVAEAAATAVYTVGRLTLGLFQSPATAGLYDGPVRIHNLLRALNAAITVPVLAAGSRYHAAADDRRLRELLVRGSRYSLALIVPLAVTGMVMAGPLLEAWLGARYREGTVALTILLAHWPLSAVSGVLTATLTAAGQARAVARWAVRVGAVSIALSIALAPALGLEGVAIAVALPYLLAMPRLLRMALEATGADRGQLLRSAFAPAWISGAALAGFLGAVRMALDPSAPLAVAGLCLAAVGAYWIAWLGLVLDRDERQLALAIVRRR